MLISEEDHEDDEEAEQQKQTARIGAKKQKKLEEKQAKKAQREVRGPQCKFLLMEAKCSAISKRLLMPSSPIQKISYPAWNLHILVDVTY